MSSREYYTLELQLLYEEMHAIFPSALNSKYKFQICVVGRAFDKFQFICRAYNK